MNIKNMFHIEKSAYTSISGFFSAYGDFGAVDGLDSDIAKIRRDGDSLFFENESFSVDAKFTDLGLGVVMREDTLVAKRNITLNRYTSRFCLDGGDYEVYTQFSCWGNESSGGWQELVTGVEASNLGIRTTEEATPMLAVRNKGNGRIFVLHLMPSAHWKIRVSRKRIPTKDIAIVVEAGINDDGLAMHLKSGERVDMPRLVAYETQNTRDFDAWKIHRVFNKLYPRRVLPVIYNNWLNTFDWINVEDIKNQAKTASELGVELFLIDAGWFGFTENWNAEIGNWNENLVGGYRGRVGELADYVRSLGMKFGMWIEPERVLKCTEAYKSHPEYYINGSNGIAFLDFANDEARRYITDIVLNLIEKYGLEYLKLDFNGSLGYDPTHNGFYYYFKGVKRFISEIRQKHPDIYITNCASGGNRMDLETFTYYDSVWSSDNQSPIHGFRIFKDTALRVPPCYVEKYDVRRFFDGFPNQYGHNLVTLPISCDGSTWARVHNVTCRYTHAFLTGGPLGFSTNIASYPESEKAALKAAVDRFKADREFYRTAEMRVIHDADAVTAVQYSDAELSRVIVQIFTSVKLQDKITVYPVVESGASYMLDGKALSAEDIESNGIYREINDVDCVTVELTKITS
ncbi:MAG: alpha-galactosidase [Clostridia bacterium]|nr:alpha-galactosidase [Clostridia bacterium]